MAKRRLYCSARNLLAGFTLLEILIVLIIVGILAVLSFNQYYSSIDKSKAKEAFVALKLLYSAEDIYRSETGSYWPASGGTESNIANINNALRLNLNTANWNYAITGPDSLNWNASASGIGRLNACTYTVDKDNADPTGSVNCPSP